MFTALQMLVGFRVHAVVDASANAVDPAKCQRFVERFGIRHSRNPRAPLVEADEQFSRRIMMALEPRPKVAA